MLKSFTYLDWSSLLIHLSGIISYISLETQLLQDVLEHTSYLKGPSKTN